MTRFLLDANLSPETGHHLASTRGLDIVDLLSMARRALTDEAVAALALELGRVVITFDLDFGELYHRSYRGRLGVILLRLDDQTVESVNRVLDRFLDNEARDIDLERSLVIVGVDSVRVVGP